MDEHKTESNHGGSKDGVIRTFRQNPVGIDKAIDQSRYVLPSRRDVIGDGGAGRAVVHPDEAAIFPPSHRDETLVADHDFLQPQQFVRSELPLTRLANRAAPALGAVIGRSFAFDGVGSLRVLQKQESGGAGQNIGVDCAYRLLRLRSEVRRDERFEFRRAPNQRAEIAGAREVIANPMPLRDG